MRIWVLSSILLLALLVVDEAPAQQGPTVTFTPDTGAPGTATQFNGEGFTDPMWAEAVGALGSANAPLFELVRDAGDGCVLVVEFIGAAAFLDSEGYLQGTGIVGTSAGCRGGSQDLVPEPGTYNAVLGCETCVIGQFTITEAPPPPPTPPSVAFTPNSGPPGTSVFFSGEGFLDPAWGTAVGADGGTDIRFTLDMGDGCVLVVRLEDAAGAWSTDGHLQGTGTIGSIAECRDGDEYRDVAPGVYEVSLGGYDRVIGHFTITAPVADAETVHSATPHLSLQPASITPSGAWITYWVNTEIPLDDLPATILSVRSDRHGDVADPANPAIGSTNCALPFDWQHDSVPGGAVLGWGCEFTAWEAGPVGEIHTTVSVDVSWPDGTELTVSKTASLAISNEVGAIRGIAVDAGSGEPASGQWIYLTGPQGSYCTDGETGHRGEFACEGLVPGEYALCMGDTTVWPSEYGYQCYDDAHDPDHPTPITVQPGEITYIELTLILGGVIEGVVTNEATGEPIEGERVQIKGDWVAHMDYVTDADGAYRIGGLATGDYIICFGRPLVECWDNHPTEGRDLWAADGDTIHIELGEIVSGIDAAIAIPAAPQSDGGNGAGGGAGNGDTLPRTGTQSLPSGVIALILIAGGVMVLSSARHRSSAG